MAEGRPTFSDVYCGGGGFSLGLKQAGLKHLWGLDNDKAACATYEDNIGKTICADAASVDWLTLERPDVLIGSPPCQGFSVAGKRLKDDPRNNLVWGFIWAVAVLRPRAILIENVPGVGQGDWAQFPSIIRMALETLGYKVSVFKLEQLAPFIEERRLSVTGILATKLHADEIQPSGGAELRGPTRRRPSAGRAG